ncbi:MAG: hypothetical protein GZ094_17220 [Mariniphaga sp.]|nr:hypothetical protein [Mariniphaga sp.]
MEPEISKTKNQDDILIFGLQFLNYGYSIVVYIIFCEDSKIIEQAKEVLVRSIFNRIPQIKEYSQR